MNEVFQLLFPPCCPVCKKPGFLCDGCQQLTLSGHPDLQCIRCGEISNHNSCSFCIEKPLPFRSCRSAFRYGPIERAFLHAIKFRKRSALIKTLAIKAAGLFSFPEADWDMVLPIPSHPNNLKERGFHVTALLSYELKKHDCFPHSTKIYPEIIVRSAGGSPQSRQRPEERHKNVKDRYSIKQNYCQNKKILLIDDVLTSGATLFEVQRLLQESRAAAVDAFTLFRTRRWRHLSSALDVTEDYSYNRNYERQCLSEPAPNF